MCVCVRVYNERDMGRSVHEELDIGTEEENLSQYLAVGKYVIVRKNAVKS